MPIFVQVEADIRAQLEALRTSLEVNQKQASEQAEAIRREGQDRLGALVLEAQEQAIRVTESTARDRISKARIHIQRWIDEAEQDAQKAVREALDLCNEG